MNNTPDKYDELYLADLASLRTKLDAETLEQIKSESNYIINNANEFEKQNKVLAGNLEKEYGVSSKIEEILTPIVIDMCKEFFRKTDQVILNGKNWKLDKIWINFQKKYEYNPPHKHSGEMSFVLWVNIPYSLEEELNLSHSVNSNSPLNSIFQFMYTNMYGEICDHRVFIDRDWEGTLVIFPAKLKHCVFPFYTSDDYRVSISGNLIVE